MRALILLVLCAAPRIAVAHPGPQAGSAPEPWVLAALLAAIVLYGCGVYRLVRAAGSHHKAVTRCALLFVGGWTVLAGALIWPLAGMTRGLFSAHMLQHELLMTVAAPLLVLARPLAIWTWAFPQPWRAALARPFRRAGVRASWRGVSEPLPASMLHGAAIWLWHVPMFFEAAEQSVALHALQHSAFFVTALLFWWALLRPGRDRRVGVAILCLFVTMLHTGALGALLTFTNSVWYSLSTAASASWGLTPVEDQQLGGLLMWIPGGTAYAVAALALVARWLTRDAHAPAKTKSELVALRLIPR